jgi:hypothetical protein
MQIKFKLTELARQEEYYCLIASSDCIHDGSPRAMFHKGMGLDVAIVSSKAICDSFADGNEISFEVDVNE